MFVPRDNPPKVLQPTNGPLDGPTSAVAAQFAAVLFRRFRAVCSMRADQFGALRCQAVTQRITIGSLVVDQPWDAPPQDSTIQQVLDQRDFIGAGTVNVDGEGQALSVDQEHDLRAFAALGLADAITPFFAEENVPSAIACSSSTLPVRSRERSSRPHAFSQTPAVVHSFNRRQQVTGEGKRFGKSFQRAPVRSTHKMPSTQGRAGTRGRPPSTEGSGAGNKFAIRNHCSSLSCDSGSVLDPAGTSRVPLARDRSQGMLGLLSEAQTSNCVA